jgi:hypothetical protein
VFIWDEPQQQAFQELKAKLSSIPIFKRPIKDDHSNYTLIETLWVGICAYPT